MNFKVDEEVTLMTNGKTTSRRVALVNARKGLQEDLNGMLTGEQHEDTAAAAVVYTDRLLRVQRALRLIGTADE